MGSTFDNSALSQLMDSLWTVASTAASGHPFGAVYDVENDTYYGTSRCVHSFVLKGFSCNASQSRAGWFVRTIRA